MADLHLFPDAAEQVAIAIDRHLLAVHLNGPGPGIRQIDAEQMRRFASALCRAAASGDTTLALRVGDPLAERYLTLDGVA